MWQRSVLKERAKNTLRSCYWYAFLVSLVVGIVTGDGFVQFSFPMDSELFSGRGFDGGSMVGFGWLVAVLIAVVVFVIFLAIAFSIFVGLPLIVGKARYYLSAEQGDSRLNYLGYGFGKGSYGNLVKTMFLRGVFTFLWGLACVIPGIIKQYTWRLVPYLLADNPQMDSKRALKLSEQLMRGHKIDTFVLDLSFVGWYLLACIPCGMGIPFLMPYVDATNTELYLHLRGVGLEKGLCSPLELNLVPVCDPSPELDNPGE